MQPDKTSQRGNTLFEEGFEEGFQGGKGCFQDRMFLPGPAKAVWKVSFQVRLRK